jgi:hypothetical protein
MLEPARVPALEGVAPPVKVANGSAAPPANAIM